MAKSERVIFLSDCQSFCASVEKATHPGLENLPVVVNNMRTFRVVVNQGFNLL